MHSTFDIRYSIFYIGYSTLDILKFDADRCFARCQVLFRRNPTVSAGPVGV
jgi:hypothetical protein